jgi:hypothetical protein
MSVRDMIEPRACIALRLEEIDIILVALSSSPKDPICVAVEHKLGVMRQRLIFNARETIPALEGEPFKLPTFR